MLKKAIAEFIGTFVLVLFGTGVAVIGGGIEGIGTLGIAMAFGLSIVAMAYSIGTISGCHINPAVSVAMFINKKNERYGTLLLCISSNFRWFIRNCNVSNNFKIC